MNRNATDDRIVIGSAADGSAVGPDTIGGKAYNLTRLEAADAAVPPWIAIPAGVFANLVDRGRPWPATADDAEARRAEVRELAVPESLREAVRTAIDTAGLRGRRLAVRSSAVGEDAGARSFAGQFDTVLGVRVEDGGGEALWNAIRRVWASAYNVHAAAYAATQSTDDPSAAPPPEPPRMAVLLQAQIDADIAGVAFSADPVTGDRGTAVVSAVFGLGEALVSGALDADTYRVAFPDAAGTDPTPGPVWRTVAHKEQAIRLADDGGTRTETVPPDRVDAPTLDDDGARRIARVTRRIARAFGRPQDVEWALADEAGGDRRLFILQARPITTLDATGPAGTGERRIWDNSNIVESYSGVVAPLTFSFARSVYEDVYRQFCELLGVSEALIDRHRHVFSAMLGRIRGRVYYNLLNWYRMLALLPGFALNRAFMERMMGVAETLDDPPEPPRTGSRWADGVRVLRTLRRMAREHRRLRRTVPAFRAHVDEVLGPLRDEALDTWPADDLVGLYRRLEDELLRRWQVPIVNDFFAMVWFGVLGRLVERWLPDAPATLVNELLCGEGGIVSTEPARDIMALAKRVADDPALSALFEEEPDDEALRRRIESDPAYAELSDGLRAYLDRFGDRCANELKLETVTPSEDPAYVLRLVRAYAAQGTTDPEAGREREVAVRREAEATVRGALRGPRRALFRAVLRRTRDRVRDRENLRFERTRVFGVVRRIFLGLGRSLVRDGRIDEPRDVFHLTIEELFAHVDGTGPTGDLRELVALRRSESDAYERAPAPPDRFETRGPPDPDGPAVDAARTAATDDGDELSGLGCCPGVVRAPVRIVRDPAEAPDLTGCILVAERTDPGWTLLFPAAAGLLVERGSLLSHSAIVAREMGLPCVVAVPSLLDRLEDGEVVEMDGTRGTVRRVEAES